MDDLTASQTFWVIQAGSSASAPACSSAEQPGGDVDDLSASQTWAILHPIFEVPEPKQVVFSGDLPNSSPESNFTLQ